MIVLFTDFGLTGPYMGQMTAVLKRNAPTADVVTLFADAPRRNPRASSYLLAAYSGEFPVGTIFLCVVDPGVGSARAGGILDADGRWFVGPDNGLFAIPARRCVEPPKWHQLTETPEDVSATFHGRDIFAPVAAALAVGRFPLCDEVPVDTVRRPAWPDDLAEIIYIDDFGNAMTGLRAGAVNDKTVICVGDAQLHRARTFSDVPEGCGFWYENANGLLEIALNCANAADSLGLKIGDPIGMTEV
jgi:S-adenosyl-L-methionine hydrolase (adenosine-forming)